MNYLFRDIRKISFGVYRSWSAKLSSTEPNSSSPNKDKRKRSNVSVAKRICHFLRESETFVANYNQLTPGLFRSRHVPPASLYCLSDSTADILFEAMKAHVSPRNIILEINPGLGLVTKKILSLCPSALYAYEPDPNFRGVLSSLASSHPELTIFPKHFLNSWKEDIKENICEKERSRFIPDLVPNDWKSDPTVLIFGAVPSYRFIQYLMHCVTLQQGIITYGRPELFFVTIPEIFAQLKYDKMSPLTVRKFTKFLLFSIYFDIECLCKIDDRNFVPWFRKRKSNPKHTEYDAANCLVFVRAVPKRDLFDIMPTKLLKPLWFFIIQSALRPKSKVIPYLEKWIPGCGPMFIAKELSVFTEFRDLSPPALFDVFLTFANHPDYASSQFNTAVESYMFKAESDALEDEVDEQKTSEDAVGNLFGDGADKKTTLSQ